MYSFQKYRLPLLRFFVQSMSPAEFAILFDFHSFGMGLLVLCCIVVTLFALCTCQCDSRTHIFFLQFLSIKKRPNRILCDYNTIKLRLRQLVFGIFHRGIMPLVSQLSPLSLSPSLALVRFQRRHHNPLLLLLIPSLRPG